MISSESFSTDICFYYSYDVLIFSFVIVAFSVHCFIKSHSLNVIAFNLSNHHTVIRDHDIVFQIITVLNFNYIVIVFACVRLRQFLVISYITFSLLWINVVKKKIRLADIVKHSIKNWKTQVYFERVYARFQKVVNHDISIEWVTWRFEMTFIKIYLIIDY